MSSGLSGQIEVTGKQESSFRKKTSLTARQVRLAWVLILPTLLVLFLIVGYPLADAFVSYLPKSET